LKVKGHDILIEAVSKLNFENNLMIIGDGEEYKNLISLVKKFNIYNRFKSVLHVNQNELNNYINNCNIFCMPSRSDALPAAALEAMACGRPVVACGVGGLKDIIIDGFNGFLTKPDDPISFANGLKRAREHIWDYKKISYWTKNNYGWEKSVNQLHEFMINNE